MAANTFGQIGATARTQVHAVTEKVRTELVPPEALAARDTLGHRMTPAVAEEEGTFLGAQITRSSAVDVSHHIAAKLNRVFRGYHLQASRALRLRHFCTLMGGRPLVNDALDQLMYDQRRTRYAAGVG